MIPKTKTLPRRAFPLAPCKVLPWAAAAVLCLGSIAQAQITDQLVVHLPFDNAYTNSRNNGIDGTAVGSPTFAAGKLGEAVVLTTLKDSSVINYVTLGSPPELDFGSVRDGTAVNFSISFWCNYTNQVDDPPFISNKNWNSSNNQGWGIFTQGGGNFRVNITDDTGSNGKQNTTSTPVIRDGTWHHVVVTVDRTNVASVYVDGALKTTSSMAPVQGPITPAGLSLNIGQDGTGAYTDGGSADMENVLMDDLGIWRRVLSAGEVTAIYNAGLGGTNLANVPVIVNPYVNSTVPAGDDTGVAPNLATMTVVIVDAINALAPNSVRLLLNGVPLATTITKNGNASTIVGTVTNVLPAGINTGSIIFGNNATPQGFFTNTWSFSVASYVTLSPDLRVTADTSKPGFVFNIFANQANQVNSNERTEAALAGLLTDASGAPLPNLADPAAQGVALAPGSAPNPANAPIKFEIPTVINLNVIGGSSAGNFPSDGQMPGMPATDGTTDGTAAEILTYLDLPAGITQMGVNSDDGFRTTAGKPPQDVLQAFILGEFEGSRGAADTTFYINVPQAGVYAFRTTWENGNGGADIEWFTVKPDGTKVLVNDTANGGIAAYRAATVSTGPYVRYISPPPVQRQMNQVSSSVVVVLADGTTALDDSSVQFTLDGSVPVFTKNRQGSNLTLTYTPSGIQFPEDQHQAQLSFKASGATSANTAFWGFCSLKNVVLPAPVIFENFDSYAEDTVPTGWTQINYTDTDVPGDDIGNLHSDSYKGWVVVSADRLQTLKARIFNGPAPNQLSNGVPVTSLSSGNLIYAESDVRAGNQVQFLYTKPYDLSAVKSAAVGFSSLYEQNQDNLGAVEYSVDGGTNWLPVVYYLDFVDSGGDIRVNPDTTVDAVLTFTEPNTDTAAWTVNGVAKGGNYGDGIAAPITQALGRFIAPRANDDSVEGKRFEIYRLPLASGKSDVRLRFAQIGTASWYFGVDNLGFYDVTPPVAPKMTLTQSPGGVTVSWIGAGTLLESATVTGPWTVSPVQVNPQSILTGVKAKFYRIGPP